jgi:hypothetical protein
MFREFLKIAPAEYLSFAAFCVFLDPKRRIKAVMNANYYPLFQEFITKYLLTNAIKPFQGFSIKKYLFIFKVGQRMSLM